jgi:hypothetical protein
MREYDLIKEYMAYRMQEAEHARLIQQAKPSQTRLSRLFSMIKRSQPANVSSEKTTGVPAHQLTPSGTR